MSDRCGSNEKRGGPGYHVHLELPGAAGPRPQEEGGPGPEDDSRMDTHKCVYVCVYVCASVCVCVCSGHMFVFSVSVCT